MRISDWAVKFNLAVKPNEARPDNPTGEVVYRVRDIFTTRDGSWEPSSVLGAVPQWARDTYLKPFGAPDYFDDAGGDHHLFARILDLNGNPVKSENLVHYWSDGFAQLGNPSYQGYVRMTPKQGSGWANQVIFNSYVPERGEVGAWCWCPDGAADVVVGGGMPANNHVSTFVVWQAEARSSGVLPDNIDPIVNFEAIRSAVWSQTGIIWNSSSALADYARRNNLGAPVTAESDIGGQRVQGFALGIVFAPIGQWQNISHINW